MSEFIHSVHELWPVVDFWTANPKVQSYLLLPKSTTPHLRRPSICWKVLEVYLNNTHLNTHESPLRSIMSLIPQCDIASEYIDSYTHAWSRVKQLSVIYPGQNKIKISWYRHQKIFKMQKAITGCLCTWKKLKVFPFTVISLFLLLWHLFPHWLHLFITSWSESFPNRKIYSFLIHNEEKKLQSC